MRADKRVVSINVPDVASQNATAQQVRLSDSLYVNEKSDCMGCLHGRHSGIQRIENLYKSGSKSTPFFIYRRWSVGSETKLPGFESHQTVSFRLLIIVSLHILDQLFGRHVSLLPVWLIVLSLSVFR